MTMPVPPHLTSWEAFLAEVLLIPPSTEPPRSMNFKSFFSPIAGAFRSAALALSKADGKPGLTAEDFGVIMGKVADIDKTGLPKSEKATWVADQLIALFGDKLPKWPWIPYAITWAAHYVARRLNLIS